MEKRKRRSACDIDISANLFNNPAVGDLLKRIGGIFVEKSVAFFLFNRPQTTKRVFAQIQAAKPKKLFLIADGPRKDRKGEEELCNQARKVVEEIQWDCEVFKNFSATNLGCKERLASGLSWVFSQVPQTIILEDDCLPHPSFFPFCWELLEKYKYEEKVGMINGHSLDTPPKDDQSYYFSRYGHVWGWASWQRVWKDYDQDIKSWPEVKKLGILDKIFKKLEALYWKRVFQKFYK